MACTSAAMEAIPILDPRLHKQNSALDNEEETYGANPAVFNEDLNDIVEFSDVPELDEASCESPGVKFVREMEASLNKTRTNQVTPTKIPVMLFQRPVSSGDEGAVSPRYHMTAAAIRPAQVKRPAVVRLQQVATSHDLARPKALAVEQENNTTDRACPTSSSGSSKDAGLLQAPTCPLTRGKQTEVTSGQAVEAVSNENGDDHEQVTQLPLDGEAVSDVVSNNESRVKLFNFAPASVAPKQLLIQPGYQASTGLFKAPELAAQPMEISDASPPESTIPKQIGKVLPSIEDENFELDGTLVERPNENMVPLEGITPKPKSRAQIQPPAPRAQRQTSVLDGRVDKRPQPNKRERRPVPQRQSHPIATAASQPSEEDLFFLLMHRSRRAKERELELAADYKKLHAQVSRLQEESRIYHQRLAAANARTERQDLEITACKSVIENFKSRFTKFKTYAKDLAKDYTDMGAAMKKIGSTTNDLVHDKAVISSALDSLRKASTSASEVVVSLRPKIATAASEAVSAQQALQLAEERVRITENCLQHERLRNNRIETQILSAQQVQEHLSLSSMQEYRKAAAYLDELCQGILHLGELMTKKKHSEETPGVLQCLTLLQALVEKQRTGIAFMTETKTLVGTVSKRLLSYHATTEEAAKTATSHGEQLSRDVLAQITASLGSIGPSIGTEVEFATLRERIASLQDKISLGHQMINLAYDGKNESERRERGQSGRLDKLITQLEEANKRQEPAINTNPPPNPGPDINVMFTKYMQANLNLSQVQSKVGQKDEELYQKSADILALRDKLKTVQAEQEATQASLLRLQEKYNSLQGSTNTILQKNASLKDRTKQLATASLQAAKVPKLMEDLAARDAEINQLRPQAAKAQKLDHELAGRDTELHQTRLEADKVPALVQNVLDRDTELGHLRPKAAKVLELNDKLAAQEIELVKLRDQAFKTSELNETLTLKEAELTDLRPKAARLTSTASQNLVLQSLIHGQKNTIRTLERQLANMEQKTVEVMQLREENNTLKIEAANIQQTIQSLEDKARESQRSVQQVETLRKEITALTINWGDHDQLKKDLRAQKDDYAKQAAQLDELQSKLEEAQRLSDQVPILQEQVQNVPQRCGDLTQQLKEVMEAVDRCQVLQHDLEQKDRDILSLTSKLQKADGATTELNALRQEIQQKSGELANLQAQIRKLQVDSQKVQTLQGSQISSIDEEEYLTQQTMLELRNMLDRGEQTNEFDIPAATLGITHSSNTHQDLAQHKKADKSTSQARHNIRRASLRLSHAHDADIKNTQQGLQSKGVDESQHIPDSQPRVEMHNVLTTSSPLSSVYSSGSVGHPADNVQVRQQGVPNSLPPSSSYGGDAMLLEDFEAVEGILNDAEAVSLGEHADMSPSHRQTKKHSGHGHVSSRTTIVNDGAGSRHLHPRSGLSSRVITKTQSQEHRSSSPDLVPSSPAGPMKHLPNSAIKRPRLDPIEATPSSQASSKRLKRTPANLELRNTHKRSLSSGTQITDPESSRTDKASLPRGSRKGTVTRANAPAPGKVRGGYKQSRKNSKSDRHSECFRHE